MFANLYLDASRRCIRFKCANGSRCYFLHVAAIPTRRGRSPLRRNDVEAFREAKHVPTVHPRISRFTQPKAKVLWSWLWEGRSAKSMVAVVRPSLSVTISEIGFGQDRAF